MGKDMNAKLFETNTDKRFQNLAELVDSYEETTSITPFIEKCKKNPEEEKMEVVKTAKLKERLDEEFETEMYFQRQLLNNSRIKIN